MENNAGININAANIQVFTSQPTRLIRHSISEEELNLLTEKTKDYVAEIMWVALGGAIGAAPSTISWFSSKDEVSANQFIWAVIIFFACLAVTLVTSVIHIQRCRRSGSLENDIRARFNGALPEASS